MSVKRGDTLIEVLFATAVFSLVAVGSLLIMNQSSATAQRALEITLVRQEIDSQAETLRFLNSSYIAAYQSNDSYPSSTPAEQWKEMKDYIIDSGATTVSSFGEGARCERIPDHSFILNSNNATFLPYSNKFQPAQTYSQLNYNSSSQIDYVNGIWIEAIRSKDVSGNDNNQGNAGYIDFYIRACWDSPGQSVPVTIDTIVRLYEPRG